MASETSKRRPMTSWIFVGALFLLCGVLGVLQYQWIGEVSVAARDRLQTTLQANLVRLSLDFNSEIASACRGLLPPGGPAEPADLESEIVSRMEGWKKSSHAQAVRRVAMVVPHKGTAELHMLDWDSGRFTAAEWPSDWKSTEERLNARLSGGPGSMEGPWRSE